MNSKIVCVVVVYQLQCNTISHLDRNLIKQMAFPDQSKNMSAMVGLQKREHSTSIRIFGTYRSYIHIEEKEQIHMVELDIKEIFQLVSD